MAAGWTLKAMPALRSKVARVWLPEARMSGSKRHRRSGPASDAPEVVNGVVLAPVGGFWTSARERSAAPKCSPSAEIDQQACLCGKAFAKCGECGEITFNSGLPPYHPQDIPPVLAAIFMVNEL
jgi:hypothetical protein